MLGVSNKMTHFNELRKIFPDFVSKVPIFYSKMIENEGLVFEVILKQISDLKK